MAAVETVAGAVDGDFQMGVATRAEDNRLGAALIDRAIADQPHIAVDEVAMLIEDLFEMRGSGFLFPFPDETDVGAERNVRSAEGIEGGELGEDGGLIIAGRASIDSLLAIDGAEYRRQGRVFQSDGVTGWPS